MVVILGEIIITMMMTTMTMDVTAGYEVLLGVQGAGNKFGQGIFDIILISA